MGQSAHHRRLDDPATAGSDEPVIDVRHLSRQCQADADLQRDLLRLFRIQCERLLERLALRSFSHREAPEVAHTLRGSALTIGAHRLAAAAAGLEAAVPLAPRRFDAALANLRAALIEAISETGRLLSRP